MNTQSKSESYAAAGVDLTAGYRAVELMKQHILRTVTPGVCAEVGGFGGLFELDVTGDQRLVIVGKLLPAAAEEAPYTVKNAESPELPGNE